MTRLATVLLIIGGLNWGLWGLFEFDLVAAIFGGSASILAKIVYTIVGLAAIYEIFAFRNIRERPVTAETRVDRAA